MPPFPHCVIGVAEPRVLVEAMYGVSIARIHTSAETWPSLDGDALVAPTVVVIYASCRRIDSGSVTGAIEVLEATCAYTHYAAHANPTADPILGTS